MNVRKLLDKVAGRPSEANSGGTIYEKVTSFAKKVWKGAETSGSYQMKTSELQEVASGLEVPLL